VNGNDERDDIVYPKRVLDVVIVFICVAEYTKGVVLCEQVEICTLRDHRILVTRTRSHCLVHQSVITYRCVLFIDTKTMTLSN
jgi:hypothetical protein